MWRSKNKTKSGWLRSCVFRRKSGANICWLGFAGHAWAYSVLGLRTGVEARKGVNLLKIPFKKLSGAGFQICLTWHQRSYFQNQSQRLFFFFCLVPSLHITLSSLLPSSILTPDSSPKLLVLKAQNPKNPNPPISDLLSLLRHGFPLPLKKRSPDPLQEEQDRC